MKKFIGIWLLTWLTVNSLACDICNMSVSLTPDDTKNSISLLHRNRFATKTFYNIIYNPVIMGDGSRHSGVIFLPDEEKQTHTEIYSVTELRGVYNFSNRLRVIASIPFIRNERIINDASQFVIQGVGDPFVMGKFNLIRTNYTGENKSNHRLTVGSGIKISLGKFDFEHEGELVQHDIQAGTGTWDFLFSVDYMWKRNKMGVFFSSNYKVNSFNEEAVYMFGNTTNITLNYFYAVPIKNVTIIPYAGGYFEHGDQDIEDFYMEENTGGNLMFGTLGLQVFYQKFQLEGMYQQTVRNDLNGTLQIDTRNRYQMGLTYLFN